MIEQELVAQSHYHNNLSSQKTTEKMSLDSNSTNIEENDSHRIYASEYEQNDLETGVKGNKNVENKILFASNEKGGKLAYSHQNQSEEDEEGFTRYFGNNIVCCNYKKEPLFSLGPHWPMFLCTFCIFAFAGYALAHYIAIKKGKFFYYGEIVVTVLLLLSYFLTAFVNPGIQTAKSSKEHNQKTRGLGYCTICRIKMDADTHHCYDCEVCIRGYDHHCPWTGKCIGEGNMFYFKCFISFLCLFFVFSMVVSAVRI